MPLNILLPLCNYAFIRTGILNSDSYKIKTSVTPKSSKDSLHPASSFGQVLALCKNKQAI